MYSPFVHPDKVIARGSAVLSTLLVAVLISSFATVDAAVRSGEVTEYVINPSRQAYQSFVAEVERQMEEDAQAKQTKTTRYKYAKDPASESESIHTEVNITTGNDSDSSRKEVQVTIQTPTPTYRPSTNTGSTLNPNFEQEALEKQAKQRAEYEAAAQKSREEYDAKVKEMQNSYNSNVEQMNTDYEQSVKEQQAKFDAFKAANGM